MIPFPLPPALSRLHAVLEGWTENHERGFFLAEQDRNNQARGQPVLMFITPHQLSAEPTPTRQGPAWMGEVVVDGAGEERMLRCAAAGVREFWRVLGVEEGSPRIEIHTEPAEAGYGSTRTYAGDEPIASGVFPGLELRPADLVV